MARALSKGKIKLKPLGEADFFDAIKQSGEKLKDINDVVAAQIGDSIYLKNDNPLDKAFGEIVHEGQHELDEINQLYGNISLLRKQTKLIVHDKFPMKYYVGKMTNRQIIEKL